ncbi:hypothetical protein COV20_01045 [Candidatus Woesearchaeota archaeon CG10_big_fil_rev_8_21_14_0_10_45_16]|nr:MAG: hypothetical protein COV20_01045 [Candidatus Woesearchaeota archaeon CG10_big_fil_rev_8_21_14_0_10_45_16]
MTTTEKTNLGTIEGVVTGYDSLLRILEIVPEATIIRKEGEGHTSRRLVGGRPSRRVLIRDVGAQFDFLTPVRVTRRLEVERQESRTDYRVDGVLFTTVENLEDGRTVEVSRRDFTNIGQYLMRTTLPGTLEQLPEETVARKTVGQQQNPYAAVGIRSQNGRHLTPVVLYNVKSEMNFEDSYGHSVRLEETLSKHWVAGSRVGREIDQNLLDLETGRFYEGYIQADALHPRELKRWMARAVEIKR